MSGLYTEPLPAEPTLQEGDVHLSCCRRPERPLCGGPDFTEALLPIDTELTCAFCVACEAEDDTRVELGLLVICQLDGRPCPPEFQP